MVDIKNRNLFFDNLKRGINIFTGAGFSKLQSPSGNILPDASELCEQICNKFNISTAYAKDLEMLSSILKRNCKDAFQKYLREQFTVTDYNELYNVLNKIKINSFITTNIDNIFQCVIDNSTRYYLNCVSYYGATKKDGLSIEYVPLHGDIRDPNSELYFGKFELSNVGNKKTGLFSIMHSKLLSAPTLFWGYGFHDGSVNEIISQVLEEGTQDIWIQCIPGSEYIQFFKDIGCNVIVATTEQLLKEIKNELEKDIDSKKVIASSNTVWNKYKIPSENQVESLPIKDFYQLSRTHWYYVITNQAYSTQWVNSIIDNSLSNKNVLVVGTPLGGKTTLQMQIARKYNSPVYYVSDLNREKAKLLCNNVDNDDERIVLVDNCAEDMEAYRILASKENIKTIAISDDFMLESSKHIIENVEYKKIIIGDIDIDEAQRIFSNIPENIRKEEFKYKQKDTDKYSMFELITSNVNEVLSAQRISEFLKRIQSDKEVFQTVLLTAYLTYYNSLLSMDIAFKYFENTTYEDILMILKRTQTFLSEIDVKLEADMEDQDYYSLRSNLFSKYTHEVAKNNYKNVYSDIIKKFITNVAPDYIYKNYVFKRRAYDANLFKDLFDDKGDEIYKIIYSRDASAYTLQQWALYKAKNQRFTEAFSDIDKAINMQPQNFSIKNARAIILFEANKDKDTEVAKNSLLKAMEILEDCYKSDKRKVYHAQKYAEFAIWIFNKYKETDHLNKAIRWIDEIIKNEESLSFKTKQFRTKLQECLNEVNK